MSEPIDTSVNKLIDDTELAQYLSRKSGYSERYTQAYGDAEADAVPPELDRLVLAQSDGTLATRKIVPTSRWRRWAAPMAVAAASVFAVTVVMEIGDRGSPTQSASPVVVTDIGNTEERRDASAQGIGESTRRESVSELIADQRVEQLALEPVAKEIEAAASSPTNSETVQPERKRREETVLAFSQSKQAAPIQDARAPAPAPTVAFAPEPEATAKLEEQLADAQLNSVSTDLHRRQAPTNAETSIQAVPQERANQPSSGRAAAAPKFDTRVPNDVAPARSPVSPASPAMTALRNETPRSADSELRARVSANRDQIAKKVEAKPAAPPLSKEVREGTAKFWLAYIRDLRTAGRNVEADAEWKAYIKAYPKYPVALNDPARPQ